MQTCTTCQHESPLGAKFCRQCGAPLFVASAFSETQTRNYGRQGPAPVGVSSGALPPSVADVLGADTARQYQPLAVAAAPAPVSINTAPIKKKFAPWTMLAVMLALLIGLALGATFSFNQQHEPTPEEIARQEAAEREASRRQEMQDRIQEAQDHAREMQDSIREAQERAREAAELTGESGEAAAPANAKPLDLSQYEFPGSTIGSYVRIPGHEMLIIRTYNNYEAIKQFYQKKLGPPLVQINEEDDQVLVFQSNGQSGGQPEGKNETPPVMVSVEKDDDGNQFKIIVMRSPLPAPQN